MTQPSDQPIVGCYYEIRVEGRLGETWTSWFEHLQLQVVRNCPDFTILRLFSDDASLLHGVLAQIGSMNIKLLSVIRQETRS